MGAVQLLLCTVLIVGICGEFKNDCQYSCGEGFRHTMCMSEGTGEECEGLQLTPTDQLKEEILVWHNLYRNELAGGHTSKSYVPNMQKLYWDEKLEQMARIWASQCKPEHDRCRQLRRFQVGQNIGLLEGDEFQTSLKTFVQWVNPGPISKKYFLRPGLVRSHPDPDREAILRRYFQVIWPDTYLIGCGEATYVKDGLLQRLLVCNYGPSAFERRSFDKIFSRQPPCSSCSPKTACPRNPQGAHPFSNLCAISSRENEIGEAELTQRARQFLRKLQKPLQTKNVILPGGRHLEHNRGNKYCQIKCDGRKHIMCHPQRKLSSHCHGRNLIDQSETMNIVLNTFNGIRNQVAGNEAKSVLPNASNMRKLVWDKELTKLATAWAKKCPTSQDSCRDVERFSVNQLVITSISGNNDNESLAEIAVNTIKDSVKFYDPYIVSQYDLPADDLSADAHVSQVIWAKSHRIGCAEVVYVTRPPTKYEGDDHTAQLSSLVCNFGEAGNVRGKPVYEIGEPCTLCPEGTSCTDSQFRYLCVEK